MTEQAQLRVVLIGASAGVYPSHQPALQLPELRVVGMADIQPQPGQGRADEFGAPFFADYQQMLAEVRPDLAVVIVPHTIHARVVEDCLRHGSDVLCEKPIALQVSEADAMIATATETGRRLGIVFQHRFRPDVRAAKALIASGAIGTIQHVELTAIWTRAASYYRLGAWRGTWKGEGGGVLMNQAPHHLDLLCHLVGQPSMVFAATRTTRQAIQTEDTVQGHLEWANGALGSLHASTAEGGPRERFQIIGTAGMLEMGDNGLHHWRFANDIDQHIATAEPFASLEMEEVPVTVDKGAGDHVAVYRQLIEAIQHGTPFTDGVEGRMSLELANALNLSSHTQAPVHLPVDRAAYAELLAGLQAS